MRTVLASLAGAAVLIGGLPRVLLAAGTLPDMLRPFTWSDPLFTYVRGLSGHRLPYVDGLFEYPPLLGFAAGVFSWLAPNAVWYVAAWTIALALCAAATAYLLASHASATRVAAAWSLAPQLVLMGSLNFDLVAVVFLTAAIVAQRRGASLMPAVLLALGAVTKLFPAAALPAALVRVREKAIAAAVFVAIVGALTVPTLLASSSAVSGVVYYASLGSNLDSPWGMLARVFAAFGLPAADGIVLAITLIGLVVTYAFALRHARAEPAVAAGLAVLAVMLWTRRYSPQYSLWILPTLALTSIPGRTVALLAVADTVVFLTVSPLTLVPREGTSPTDLALLGALAAAVVLRHAGLVMTWRSLVGASAEAAARAPVERSPRGSRATPSAGTTNRS